MTIVVMCKHCGKMFQETLWSLVFQVDEDSNDEVEAKKVCLSFNEQEAAMSPAETLNDFLNSKESPVESSNPVTNGNNECSNASMPVLQEIYSSRFDLIVNAIVQN